MSQTRQLDNLIWQDPDRVSGAVCFFGTRVPVQHMLDYIQGGQRLEEFVADYNIPLAQAKSVLELTVSGLESLMTPAA